jgi:hypothetical protein
MWMHPRHPDPCSVGQLFQPAGGRVPVHPYAVGITQDQSRVAAVDGSVDRPSDGRR